ncbi:12428_t:CDS:2 [Gigaspora margarita]|uniref:12428_t:CDS:1 n=1 Tax=Gigaspora margarita TaxID=4874 RepID=A0ABN7UHG3_GIGMA|nr:12428_t:CDS:2 [Gigaspora margarita]
MTMSSHKSNKCQLKNELSYDSSQETYPFTIVTGASSDHYCALQSWLYYTSLSLSPIPEIHRPRIIVYDLGLVNFQRNALNYLHQKNYFTHYKLFNFLKYPSFWNISISKGEYAWKPAIIAETFREFPGIVLWLDSGTFVSTDFLMNVEKLVNAYDGFFSPKSSGNLLKWTHPGVFKYFNDSTKKTKYKKSINCNAATLLFDTSRISHIIKEWENCAHKKECIAPNGSNRTNHRQDQAILSYLMIKNNRNCDNYGIQFGIRTHMDKYCAQMIWEYEEIYGEFWSPNAQDMKEMKEIIENFPELSIYDIWTKSGKDAILEEIKKSGNYSLKLGDVFR